jgi:hypothetical protein
MLNGNLDAQKQHDNLDAKQHNNSNNLGAQQHIISSNLGAQQHINLCTNIINLHLAIQ